MNSSTQMPAGFAPVNDPNELAQVEGGRFLSALFACIRDVAGALSRFFGGVGL